jgi:hypothetical protein
MYVSYVKTLDSVAHHNFGPEKMAHGKDESEHQWIGVHLRGN